MARKQRKPLTIVRVYTRHYTDNGQDVACVDWSDGSCTVGPAYTYHGILLPQGPHMGALFDRAIREGLTVERETW